MGSEMCIRDRLYSTEDKKVVYANLYRALSYADSAKYVQAVAAILEPNLIRTVPRGSCIINLLAVICTYSTERQHVVDPPAYQ